MSGLSLDERRLKEETRALHRAVGGLEEAARITGKSKSQHGRMQSQDAPDFITAADVLKLEAVGSRDAGWPAVTRLLAERAGGVFVPLPDVEADADDLAAGVMTLAKEFGDLAGAIQQGLADGVADDADLLRAAKEGAELQRELTGFMRLIESLLDANSPAVSALREVSQG